MAEKLHMPNKRNDPVRPEDNFLSVPVVLPSAPSYVDKADGQIDVELRLHGKRFVFRFDIPDATGTVPITDVDRQRMLGRIMDALNGRFGKLRVRAEL